jgi:hypothetical protein
MRCALLRVLFLVLAGCGSASPPPGAPAGPSSAAAARAPEPAADPSTLSVPAEAAAPCTRDAMCMNHRCNVAFGKCAFPCATDADCVRGTRCYKAAISTCQRSPPGAEE